MTAPDPSSTGPDPLADPDALLDLAAWLDGRAAADPDRVPDDAEAALESRLSRDAALRALATSARLAPVTPADLAAPAPAALVERAAALVPSTPRVTVEPAVAGRWADQARLRGLLRTARSAVAAAACIGALVAGWQLGGGTGARTTETGSPTDGANGVVATAELSDSMVLATVSFGVFEDDGQAGGVDFLMPESPSTGSEDAR